MERSPFGADVSSNGSRRVESAKSTAVVFPRRQITSGPFRGAVCVCVAATSHIRNASGVCALRTLFPVNDVCAACGV